MSNPTDGFGVYENISPDVGVSVYGPRLKQIASAGFKLVLNYDILNTNTSGLIYYINYAYSLGLKVIMGVHTEQYWKFIHIDHYPQLYADAGNPGTLQAMITYIVQNTMNLPGVWGWYCADEPQIGDAALLLTWCTYIRNADTTGKPRLIVEEWYNNNNNFWQGVPPFSVGGVSPWDNTYCEVGGDDIYPLGDARFWQPATYTVAAGIQATCKARGIRSCIVLQAFSQTIYFTRCTPFPSCAPWPSSTFMREQIRETVANMDPQIVLFYSYFDIAASNNPTLYFSNLQSALDLKPIQSNYVLKMQAINPISWYRLDETYGITAVDIARVQGEGTINNDGLSPVSVLGVRLGSNSLITTDSDASMSFDGTQGFIANTTIGLPTGAQPWSMGSWVSTPGTQTGYKGILAIGQGGNGANAALYYTTQYNAQGQLGVSSSGVIDLFQSGTFTKNVPHFLVATYDGNNLKVYLDGQLVNSAVIGALNIGYGIYRIGLDIGTGYFLGTIDEPFVTNYALSATQISDLYNASIPQTINPSIVSVGSSVGSRKVFDSLIGV